MYYRHFSPVLYISAHYLLVNFAAAIGRGPYRMMGAVARQKLFLIDSFGFIFRAYHARARTGAPPMRTSTGFSTEAVYIFNNMLRKLTKQHAPPYIAAVFETTEATHRVQEFAEY